MKILLTLVMVLLAQISFVGSAFAETKEEKRIIKIKTEIAKLGTGPDAKIEVKMKGGSKVKGHVTAAGEDQFVVLDAKTGQNVTVPYPQVQQAKGNNFTKRVIIGIGVVLLAIVIIITAGKS